MNLTNDDVQEILQLLDSSAFDELTLETDRFKLTLRRTDSGGWTQENQTLSSPRLAEGSTAAAGDVKADNGLRPASATSANPASTAAPDPVAKLRPQGIEVRAPIVGTFYRAPKPGAEPFVQIGSQVTSDTVIGIVETMKMMNSVYAGGPGEVVQICAVDGQFVEQDQVLLRLQQDAK